MQSREKQVSKEVKLLKLSTRAVGRICLVKVALEDKFRIPTNKSVLTILNVL